MVPPENPAIRKESGLTHVATPRATSEAALARLQGLRVLVVDDNKFARSLLRNALQVLGIWRITECMTVNDGLACLAEETIDLVLIENQMTKGSGIAFTRAVRRSETVREPAVPIIMVSGQTDMVGIKQAIDSGVHDYLAKPFSAASLASRLIVCLTEDRPLVQYGDYIGPCRRNRRLQQPAVAYERRKTGPEENLS